MHARQGFGIFFLLDEIHATNRIGARSIAKDFRVHPAGIHFLYYQGHSAFWAFGRFVAGDFGVHGAGVYRVQGRIFCGGLVLGQKPYGWHK